MKFIAFFAFALLACGGRVTQAPACATYVACIGALDAQDEQGATNVERFAPEGACWSNGATAELCQTGCERALERMRARSTQLPGACAP